MWIWSLLLASQVTPLGLISDVVILAVVIGTDENCNPAATSVLNTGAIAGGSVGGFVCLIITCCIFCRKKG